MYKKQKGKFRPIVAMVMSLVLVLSPCAIWHTDEIYTPVEVAVPVFNEIQYGLGDPICKNENLFIPIKKAESEVIELKETVTSYRLADDEIDLIALITMAEAEGECEDGQRLVIDVILNRLEHERFANTINEVIYSPKQFSSAWNGRADRCYVKEELRQLVIEELEFQMNYDIVYFRTERYGCGTPAFKVGNHYFSSL